MSHGSGLKKIRIQKLHFNNASYSKSFQNTYKRFGFSAVGICFLEKVFHTLLLDSVLVIPLLQNTINQPNNQQQQQEEVESTLLPSSF